MDVGLAGFRRERVVRLMDAGSEVCDKLHSCGRQLSTKCGKLTVPNIKGGKRTGTVIVAVAPTKSLVGGFEQGVSLAQNLVVVGFDTGKAGLARGHNLVEVATSFSGFAAHQRQVFRRK